MNTTIEQAIAAWIASLSAFAGISIHAGQSDEEIPNDLPVIYVVCNNTESPAPSLYSASVQIIISTPEVIVDNLDVHQSLVASMRTALREVTDSRIFSPLPRDALGPLLTNGMMRRIAADGLRRQTSRLESLTRWRSNLTAPDLKELTFKTYGRHYLHFHRRRRYRVRYRE